MDVHSLLPTEELITSILSSDVKELPSLPVIATKLLEITGNDQSSSLDLAKVIETDPALMTKVLKIANSAAFGLQYPVSSVKDAVVRLGFSEVRNLALGITLFDDFVSTENDRVFDHTFFWQHCLSVATLSRTLAEILRYDHPEEAYIAGLLHDVGKIIIDVYGRISYGDFLNNASHTGDPIIENECKLLGVSHDDVGAFFADRWRLPPNIILAIKYHHQPIEFANSSSEDQLLPAIIAFANFVAWTQGIGSVAMLTQPILQPFVESVIPFDEIDLPHLFHKMDTEITSIGEFYHFKFPTPEQLRENLLRTNIELGRISSNHYFKSLDSAKPSDVTRPDPSPPKSEKSAIAPQELLQKTFQVIHQEFQYDRLCLFRLNPKRRGLILEETFMADTAAPFDRPDNDFNLSEIPIHPKSGGIIDCMREKKPVIIYGKTIGEKETLHAFNSKEIGLIPLLFADRVKGILTIDNHASNAPIKKENLTHILVSANRLCIAQESAKLKTNLDKQENLDPLTRLLNRLTIEKHIDENFSSMPQTPASKLSLAFVEIDHFKRFNDQFGHLSGDSILKLLAGILKKFSRTNDLIARFFGARFIILCPDTDRLDAMLFGERIQKEMTKLGQILMKRFPDYLLTVSIGIAMYHPKMASKEELIEKAEFALNKAKETGDNSLACAGENI